MPYVCRVVCRKGVGDMAQRSRKVSLVCYEEPTLQQLSGAIKWSYILHDKDVHLSESGEVTEKKPHYHVYLEFGNPRYLSSIAKDFNLPEAAICKVANTKATLAYMTHRTARSIAEGKHMYDPEEVIRSEDMDFDFSVIVDSAETVNWLHIFSQPTLQDALSEYKRQGEEILSLQTFKNFVQCYHLVHQIEKVEEAEAFL